jgi:hypothetical protein
MIAGGDRSGMDPVFTWIEATSLSTWLRDDLWAFPVVLIFHTVGLAFLVGVNVAVDARILGLAQGVPLASLDRYFPVMWVGFWVNAMSGLALLLAYPTKALTNPLFYVKLACIAGGLLTAHAIRVSIRAQPAGQAYSRLRALAVASLLLWVVGITTGRLLAYTYSRLTVDFAG